METQPIDKEKEVLINKSGLNIRLTAEEKDELNETAETLGSITHKEFFWALYQKATSRITKEAEAKQISKQNAELQEQLTASQEQVQEAQEQLKHLKNQINELEADNESFEDALSDVNEMLEEKRDKILISLSESEKEILRLYLQELEEKYKLKTTSENLFKKSFFTYILVGASDVFPLIFGKKKINSIIQTVKNKQNG
jgi:septal ring factor EnvC (AmiA/AmiB activator)